MSQEEREILSLIIQTGGLLATIVFVAICRKKKKCVLAAIVIMFLANFVGQVLIAGGGPGAFAGAILLPFLGVIVALITCGIANLFCRKRNFRDKSNGKSIR